MFTAMSAYRWNILFLQFIFIAVCFSEITNDQKDKYLSGFVDFLNNVPNKSYIYENGVVINVKEDDTNTYKIEIKVKATDVAERSSIKYVRCSCTIRDGGTTQGGKLVVVNDDYHCTDVLDDADSEFAVKLEEAVKDPFTSTETVQHQPIQLDNEVQPRDAATSGEQFIAVRREQPAPCIGCATHIDPAAEGVAELAELGVKHIDRHEPNTKHTLHTVNDVERQVQVVNGVRYILILTVKYDHNNCTSTENQECIFNKICKITILEKPWMKLPSGSKYTAILANNCTENWQFGDNGEIINQDENKENDQVDNDQIVKVMHNSELTSGQNEHKFMSDEELKKIQEQIIPLHEFNKQHGENNADLYNKNTDTNIKYTLGLDTAMLQKKSESTQTYTEENNNHNLGSINEEKKKVIDDLMNFLNFAGFDPKPEDTDNIPRMKRSFESDLQVMSLQEKFYKLKSHLTNAKQLYDLGQVLVDYLNEMDMEVKTRVLNDILAAEEEYEGHQNFYYIKARVNIPCEKTECSTNDTESKICNGVLDNSNSKHPKVLTAFCYKDTKIGVSKDIPLDDLIIRKLVNEAVKKIENDLSNLKALKPTKILSANMQRVSGTITKISMILEYTDCNVTVPTIVRENCTVLENLGSKICNVEVHERYWIKEKKLTYTCNDRPIDVSFSELNVHSQKKIENVNGPIAREIAQDALQYLETESNVNKRQTILKIKSVTTQMVAGVFTVVEFIVGYTDCDYNLKQSIYTVDKSIKDCKLLENQPLRLCRAQVWERPWLQDDKQFKVSCEIESSDYDYIRKETPLELDTPQERNPNDLKYYKLAEKSLKRYLFSKKINQHHKILKIEKVTTQHVSGALTKIKFVVSPTNCLIDPNGMVSPSMNCVESTIKIRCIAEIVERPRLDSTLMQANCTQITKGSITNNSRHKRRGLREGAAETTILDSNDDLDDVKRSRRNVPAIKLGGEKQEDINNIVFMELADESLKKYMTSSGITQPHKICSIVNVTTQQVSGKLTKLNFYIAPSNCEIDKNGDLMAQKCEIQTNDCHIYCHAEVWEQIWLKRKDITVECKDNNKSRVKRHVRNEPVEKDVSDPMYKILAEKAIKDYLKDQRVDRIHKVVNVVYVSSQQKRDEILQIYFQIAPTNCKLKSRSKGREKCKLDMSSTIDCHAEVRIKTYQAKNHYKVDCNKFGHKKLSHKMKRSTVVSWPTKADDQYSEENIPSYVSPENIINTEETKQLEDKANPSIKEYAEVSIQKYSVSNQITQHHKVSDITLATSFISPDKYTVFELLYEITPTNCTLLISDQTNYSTCQVTNPSNLFSCVSVITVDQTGGKNYKSTDCNINTRNKEQKLKLTTGNKNEKFDQWAQKSLNKYLKEARIPTQYVLNSVKNIESTGRIYKIEFVISPTNCLPGPKCELSFTDCEIDNTNNITCYSQVLNDKVLEVACELISNDKLCQHRAGGKIERNASDPEFKRIAQTSLNVFIHKNNIPKYLVVTKVIHATTQVLSGILTEVKFEMSPTNCKPLENPLDCNPDTSQSFTCDSSVLEKPWEAIKFVSDTSCTGDWESGAKSISVKPESLEDEPKDPNSHEYQVYKNKNIPLPGGETECDPNDPKYKLLAEESLKQYLKVSDISEKHKVTRVKKVSSHVVSGSLITIAFEASSLDCQNRRRNQLRSVCKSFNCQSKIWEQTWLNKKDITVNCNMTNQKGPKAKLSGEIHVTGGGMAQDPNRPEYKVLAEKSLQKYQEDSGISQNYKVMQIISVITQVVSGIITKIHFEASPTNCQKKAGSDCEVINCISRLWDQAWLNNHIINVNCSKDLNDQAVLGGLEQKAFKLTNSGSSTKGTGPDLGGLTKEDPNHPKYKTLAEESLQKYLNTAGETINYKVARVNSVLSQVVSGIRTVIEFDVIPADCENGHKRQSKNNCVVMKCSSNIWEQEWLSKKDISVNCGGLKQKGLQSVNDGASQEEEFIEGGRTEQDPNDPTYKILAEKALQHYLKISQTTRNYTVVKVNKVFTQVVSGILTIIEFAVSLINCQDCKVSKCESNTLDVQWLNKTDITVNCNLNAKNGEKQKELKLTSVGGLTKEDPNDPKYKTLAEESLLKYLNTAGETRGYKVARVNSVLSQVVSGIRTVIEFEAFPIDCPYRYKRQSKTDCVVMKCSSDIWEQEWMNKKDISVNCGGLKQKGVESVNVDASQGKEPVLGGLTKEDPNDPMYKTLAEESLQKYLNTAGETRSYKVARVNSVLSQVVSGIRTVIEFDAIPADCENRHKRQSETNCVVMKCSSNIWQQEWLNKKDISVNCGGLKQKGVESVNVGASQGTEIIVGGRTEQDPKNPTYKILAERALQKYLKNSQITQNYTVVTVNKVFTQVVSGILTIIEFAVAPINCQDCKVSNCESNTLDVQWLNKTDITVNCKLNEKNGEKQKGLKLTSVGGLKKEDPNNPKYKTLAEESLQKYLNTAGETRGYKVARVNSVLSQIVSGIRTVIEFEAFPIDCPYRYKRQSKTDCVVMKCSSDIWEQEWMNKRDISVNCGGLKQKGLKLSKPGSGGEKNLPTMGGEKEMDPNDPMYKILAEESLKQYFKISGISESHKVSRVKKVLTQIVSGTLTTIEFEASSTDCQNRRRNQLRSVCKSFNCRSKIWEQTWLNKKDISVNCNMTNQKGPKAKLSGEIHVTGGEMAQDPNRPEYKVLAEKSLQKYQEDSGISQNYKVMQMISVITQVVSGIITKIHFEASPANCQKKAGSDCEVINCISRLWDQEWLNNHIINVNCSKVGSSTKGTGPDLGGLTKEDPNDPKYKTLAEESLQKYLNTAGETRSYKVARVNSVLSQVVSGIRTVIEFDAIPADCENRHKRQSKANCVAMKCSSNIWEQEWLNKKDISVNCGGLKQKGVESVNVGASQGTEIIVGGRTEQDPKNPTYKILAERALQKYLKNSQTTQNYTVVTVNKVFTQVVSGILTIIEFAVAPINCQDCKVSKCESNTLDVQWLNKTDITVNCKLNEKNGEKQKGLKLTSVGGLKKEDPNNPKYKTLAEESLQKYLNTAEETRGYKVARVNSVLSQVVSGIRTVIEFEAFPIDCPYRYKRQSKTDCVVMKCSSDIWEQEWMNKKDISVNCGGLKQKGLKLSKPCSGGEKNLPTMGGEKERDPNDPMYKILAEESLKQYFKISGISESHKVSRVKKVLTQIVSGTLTTIEFEASSTDCQNRRRNQLRSVCKSFNCRSKIWEQTWLNKKDITVNCNMTNQKGPKAKLSGEIHVTGGEMAQDPNRPEYKVLAEKSLQKYQEDSGISQNYKVMQMISIITQVVSGIMTRINFEASPTNCPSHSRTDCEILSCHSRIWDQEWLDRQIIDVNCSHVKQRSRVKRELSNFNNNNVVENPIFLALANKSLELYTKQSGSTQHYKVKQITNVITQDVSGYKTKLNFEAVPIKCDFHVKNSSEALRCKLADSDILLNCHSEILERPWKNKSDITVECYSPNPSLTISGTPYGQFDEIVPNNKYKALAEESMQKYLETSGERHIFNVIEIIRGSTKAVSGSFTSLDFKISPTNCSLDANDKSICIVNNLKVFLCHSDIWERPWLYDDAKIISVECKNSNDLSLSNEDSDLNDVNHKIERLIRSLNSPIRSGAPQEQDANLPKFRKLAKEALNKYIEKKHITEEQEVVKVNRVIQKVASGFIFKINFIALPRTCYENVSCSKQETLMLKCNSVIWDRPWLKRKDIKVTCRRQEATEQQLATKNKSENDNDDISLMKDSYVQANNSKKSVHTAREYQEVKDKNTEKYKDLAQQALWKYERKSLSAYLYKVTEVLHVSESVLAGIDNTKIEFSALLTDCQVNGIQRVGDHCKIQEPNIGLRCKAEISHLIPNLDATIEVKCKNKRFKKTVIVKTESNSDGVFISRGRRQIPPDDDYIEEDVKSYYAERALSDYNRRSGTNNLHKIVTIHDTQRSYHMKTLMYRIYLEIAMTYCMRHGEEHDIPDCDEIEGMNHKLCLARIYPSPDDEMIIRHVTMVCDDDTDFQSVTGLSVSKLVKESIAKIEKSPDVYYKLAHQGEANIVPSLDYALPIRLSFLVATTNCSKDYDSTRNLAYCWVNANVPTKLCTSYIYMTPNTRNIHHIDASCRKPTARTRRSISTNSENATTDDLIIQRMVQEAVEKLEMSSVQRYKQRVLLINSFSTKITTGKETTIDFDVGYTNCLKFEWVENITSCEFIEHLPRRHCVAKVFERLWVKNGKSIDVNCEDDETPLEAHIEFESAENAMHLAREALKHIEAKYPSPQKQKVVRIFSLEKQTIAGLHYRMKIEVGYTDCVALSVEENCKLISDSVSNKFCRVNVWVRPWTEHPPSYRVSCDYQDGLTMDVYHEVQAEHLFYDFLTKHKPDYINDYAELRKRYQIFRDNIKKIHELNIYERGTARYAVTRFTDMTYEEFGQQYLGLKLGLRNSNRTIPLAEIPKMDLPDKFDWRDFDAVTEVKDQGACGSCWAFSVTGNIEGQWKMQSGQLVSLSEQELVDCDTLDHGCNGGLPDNAYRAIEQLGGLETETDYPYDGANDKCSFNKTLSKVQISGAVNISSNETDMAKWLVQNGPISIGINANAMQFYVGGISHPWKMLCNPTNLDHGVLLVGYGVKDYPLFHKRLPYWIIKNSWGARWGEQGYYRVYRGDGTCGVNKMASSAVI